MKKIYICLTLMLFRITCNAGNSDVVGDSLNIAEGTKGSNDSIALLEETIFWVGGILLLLVLFASVTGYCFYLNRKMKRMLREEIDDMRDEFSNKEKVNKQKLNNATNEFYSLDKRIHDVECRLNSMVDSATKMSEAAKPIQNPLKVEERMAKVLYAAEPKEDVFNNVSDKFIKGRSIFEIIINEDGKTGTFKVCDDITTVMRALKNNLFDSSCRTTGSKIEASSVVNEVPGVVKIGTNGFWVVETPAEIKFNK